MLPRPQGGATVKLQPANTAARYRQKRPKSPRKKKKKERKNQINLNRLNTAVDAEMPL